MVLYYCVSGHLATTLLFALIDELVYCQSLLSLLSADRDLGGVSVLGVEVPPCLSADLDLGGVLTLGTLLSLDLGQLMVSLDPYLEVVLC